MTDANMLYSSTVRSLFISFPGRSANNRVHDNIAAAELLPAVVIRGDLGIAVGN
jgi:hypothetical protein